MTLFTRRLLRTAFTLSILFLLPSLSDAGSPPAVGSGTLVAQFQADAAYLSLDGGGTDVASWTAANDNSIVLSRTGFATSNSNISFDSSEMDGNGAIVVNDFGGDNLALQGAMPGTRTASTVFFLGYFDPGRDGSSGDGSGQYIYSYGADGDDGSQLDFQIDDDNAELFGGSGTQGVGDISANNGIYTVYRIESGGGVGADWAVYANDGLVGSGTNGGNYSVSGDLILFDYQTSGGTGGDYNFVGNIGELLIYDGNLDSADIGAVESYLRDRLPDKLELQVDRGSGNVTIDNPAGASPVTMLGYSITSPNGTLDSETGGPWTPISGSAHDPGATFTVLTDRDVSTATLEDLSEFQFAGAGLGINGGQSVDMGNVWLKVPSDSEDLTFEYVDENGEKQLGFVTFTGDPFDRSDLDFDHDIDADDWLIYAAGVFVDLSGLSGRDAYLMGDLPAAGEAFGDGLNNFDDFLRFKSDFEAANPGVSFAEMVASVPEPSSLMLLTLALAGIVCPRQRSSRTMP